MTELVELLAGSTWTDITSDVYTRDEISITRGKANEAGQVAPTQCFLTLDNRLGKYSPRNPLSPYYGQIGRNTQLRVSLLREPAFDAGSSSSVVTGADLSWTHTPVGTPTGVTVMIFQKGSFNSEINSVTYGGVPLVQVRNAAATLGGVTQISKYIYHLGRDVPTGAQTVLVDVNGASQYHAAAMTVTGGSATEADASNSVTSTGTNPSIGLTTTQRAVFMAGVMSDFDDVASISAGGGMTQIAEADLGTEIVAYERTQAAQNAGVWSVGWTAAVSSAYSAIAVAIRAVDYRFWGEVSSFPARWDTSGNDAYVPIEAAGILRRLGQGTDPAETGLKAFTLANETALSTYFPLGGAVGTTYSLNLGHNYPLQTRFYGFPTAASGGPGNNGPSWKYGEDMGTFLGTGMALFHTGTASTSYMRGDVAAGDHNVAFDWVWQSDELGYFAVNLNDYSGFLWQAAFNGTPGVAQVSVIDPSLGPIGFSPTGVLDALTDDLIHHGRLQLTQNGSDTDWVLYIDGVSVDSGSHPSYELNGCSLFTLDYERTGTQSWVNLAHLTVWAHGTAANIPAAADVSLAAHGYVSEAAGDRIERITALAGYDLTAVGTLSDTAVMGPQFSEASLTQLRDAETTDLGVLAEPRDAFGLLYRTHRSLFNQDPALTLFYADGHLSPPFEPVDDDQLTRNDVTAVRREGDSYRVRQETGVLSVLEPPNGVGRYKDEVTVNVETDDMLPAVAGWLLHLGTLDEARYPSVRVNLAAPDVVAVDLEEDVLAVDIGDRILIRNAIDVNIYDDVSLIVLGYTETIGPVEHTVTFNCAPGSSYEVVELDDPTSRISSGDASTLTSSLTTTATSMSVTSTAGTLWTTSGGQMPISLMVGGEEMTVTAISGAASPQTFTVARSVNGVVKTHAAGEVVRLKRRAVWAL